VQILVCNCFWGVRTYALRGCIVCDANKHPYRNRDRDLYSNLHAYGDLHIDRDKYKCPHNDKHKHSHCNLHRNSDINWHKCAYSYLYSNGDINQYELPHCNFNRNIPANQYRYRYGDFHRNTGSNQHLYGHRYGNYRSCDKSDPDRGSGALDHHQQLQSERHHGIGVWWIRII